MTAAKLFRHETILAVLTIIAMIVLASLSDKFFTADNLLNQGRLMAEVGLISLAMTFVIVTGGIDLSVGSILGLTAILLGVFWKNVGLPLPAAMLLALACGTFAGWVNGFIITRFSVPPLIATLATLALYRGLAEGISEARSVRGYPEWFFFFGQGEVLGVPFQLWVLGIATLIAWNVPVMHSYWIPVTVAWVTLPDSHLTNVKLVARIAGTMVGALATAILLLPWMHQPAIAALVVGVGVFLTAAFLFAFYAVAVAGITMVILGLFSVVGDPVGENIIVRIVATIVAAGIVALVTLSWSKAEQRRHVHRTSWHRSESV